MLTAPLLEAEWVLRRLTGRGLRDGPIDPRHADPNAPADIVTSVIRLPLVVAARLHDLAASVVEHQPGQYAYPADAIHTTLVGPAGRPGQTVESILDDIRDVAPLIAGTRLRVAGLYLGPSTVFARLEASGGDLTGARHLLRDRWDTAPEGGLERLLRERLLWTTVVRFAAPPSRVFVSAVADRRRIRSDPFPVEAIELARTNRVMASGRTANLGLVALRP